MTQLLVKPFIKPSALNGVENGQIPPQSLTTIHGGGLLLDIVARGYNALAFKCMAIGLPLTYSLGGTYRTYAMQYTLFFQRYSTVPTTYGKPKTFQGKTYYKKLVNGSVPATAAVPGESNHGWACAIDTAFDINPTNGIDPKDAAAIAGHPQFPQFVEFAYQCGFSFETVPEEPWHIRWVSGDVVPQEVLNVEAYIDSINNPKPTTPPVVVVPPVTPPTTTSINEEQPMFIMHDNNPSTALWLVPGFMGTGVPDQADQKVVTKQTGLSLDNVSVGLWNDLFHKSLDWMGLKLNDAGQIVPK